MKLISKDALVAEIKRRLRNVNLNYVNTGSHPSALNINKKLQEGISKNLQGILSFINTLEVKEVDLEKYLKEDIKDVFFDLDGVAVKGATHYLTVDDIEDIEALL